MPFKKNIRKLGIKSAKERDFSAQEVMHHIVPLKLVSSSFNIANLSLEWYRKISINGDNIENERSILDYYAMRNMLVGYCNKILQCNLVEFVSKSFVIKNEIKSRQKEIIVRTLLNRYSNPKGVQYTLLCKY